MENPIKMDDLGVPPFSETSIYLLFFLKTLRTCVVFLGYLPVPTGLRVESKLQWSLCPGDDADQYDQCESEQHERSQGIVLSDVF